MKKIQAHLIGETVTSNDQLAFGLLEKSQFGEKFSGKVRYLLSEALYLLEKGKLDLFQKQKLVDKHMAHSLLQKKDKKLALKYPVYKDLREKGYIVKTALKFGADFRVYDKGSGPKKAHAKWIDFAESENKKHAWNEFSAKNRVAHSTKKKLLLAIVDGEGAVSYYEVSWVKP